MIVKYLLFLLLLCSSCYLKACSAAYQYSLLPLGSSMGQILMVELEMNRYLSTPQQQMMQLGGRIEQKNQTIEVRWKGSVRLMRLHADSMILEKDLGHTDMMDEVYEKTLQLIVAEALEYAQKLPLFEEATIESQGICHFDRSSPFMLLNIDTTTTNFYVSSTEKGYEMRAKKVRFSYSTLKKVENTTKIRFTDFDNIEKDYQLDFFRLWSPQSIRRYSIAGQTVIVYSLGRGDKSRYTLTTQQQWKQPNLPDISHMIVGNDVLFHGQRFDLIQIF